MSKRTLELELEGETVKRCIPHVGYLHSGFEKLGEYRHYNQIIPLTDRTDYLSPMANNVCLALAAEKLMGIEVPERCRVLRPDIHQHVLGAGIVLGVGSPVGQAERQPGGPALGVEARRGERHLYRAQTHLRKPRSPRARRSRMSAGSSSYASAMDSSSME